MNRRTLLGMVGSALFLGRTLAAKVLTATTVRPFRALAAVPGLPAVACGLWIRNRCDGVGGCATPSDVARRRASAAMDTDPQYGDDDNRVVAGLFENHKCGACSGRRFVRQSAERHLRLLGRHD